MKPSALLFAGVLVLVLVVPMPSAVAQPAVEVTLKGNAMNNAHTGEREKVAFLYAIDGTPEVKAEFDKIVADGYPDRGLDADAAVKVQDQFTRRLKYFIAGPLAEELHKKLSFGSHALALTGTIEEKDGRKWINVRAYKDAPLSFPARMLAPDKPFEAPGEPLVLKISDALSLTCIRVPAGKFLMGAPYYQYPRWQEDPPHVVTLTKPFYMSEHPVTQEIYEQVCGVNPSAIKNPKMPVHRVDCASMYKFCRLLSEKTGRKVRIPTNAEWEYAARAGTSNPTFVEKYRDQSSHARAAWTSEPMPVKSKKPNAWGFYDMHSGGWERVADTNGKIDRVDVVDPAHIPPEDSGAADAARKHGHFGKGHWSYPISECEFITSEDTDERGFYRFRVVVEAGVTAPVLPDEAAAGKGIVRSEAGKDGLQIGIQVQPLTVNALREIKAEITLRNAGKDPLTINTWDLAGGYFGLEVRDSDGKPVPKVPPPFPAPQPGSDRYEEWQAKHKTYDKMLKPGETFVFTCSPAINLTRPDGTYTVRFAHGGVTTPGIEVVLKAGK